MKRLAWWAYAAYVLLFHLPVWVLVWTDPRLVERMKCLAVGDCRVAGWLAGAEVGIYMGSAAMLLAILWVTRDARKAPVRP